MNLLALIEKATLFLSANWRLVLGGTICLALLYLGWNLRGHREEAARASELRLWLEEERSAQQRSYSIGMDLENGLNQYRNNIQESSDDGVVYSTSRVREIERRIASGSATGKFNE